CDDLAVGDSGNDIAMLEAAGTALLVRSPAHAFPTLNRVDKVIHSHHYGPAGWAEGVEIWLSSPRAPQTRSGI
ncbi:MAG: mannosyl-3-phosphoglycerate phosphatase, partial [Pseudomonadota bacterium]